MSQGDEAEGGQPVSVRNSASIDPARELAGLFTQFDQHRRVLGQRASLGTADMRLLWLLTDGTPRTLREIAQELRLEQSTVNRQVNAELGEGLVARADAEPTGPFRFHASSLGSREYDRNFNAVLDAYRQALDATDPSGSSFLDMMRRYVAAYGEAVSAADEPGEATGTA